MVMPNPNWEKKSSTNGVIKRVYNAGIQLISRMQLHEVHNVYIIQYDKGVLTSGLL